MSLGQRSAFFREGRDEFFFKGAKIGSTIRFSLHSYFSFVAAPVLMAYLRARIEIINIIVT